MTRLGYMECLLVMVVAAAILASWHDSRRRRVPNELNAIVLLSAFVAQWFCHGSAGLSAAFLGMLVGGGPLLVLWLLKFMGAGDVKYMAALGAWLGPQMTLHALVLGVLLGGVIAVCMIAGRSAWRHSVNNVGLLAIRLGDMRSFSDVTRAVGGQGSVNGVLPYAIPLSLGTLCVVFGNYFGWWKVL